MVIPTETNVDTFPVGAVDSGEALTEGLRRVALEIDRRGQDVLGSDSGLAPEGVHAVRVGTKRVRAIWQLHKATANAALAKRAIGRLRVAARTLAGLRDDHVLMELLLELSSAASVDNSSELDQARARLTTPPADHAISPDVQPGFLNALIADSEDWLAALPVDDEDLLRLGLHRSFAKTSDLGRKALRDRQPEEMHRWRRWVKYLRYQLEPLATPERASISAFYFELKQLGSVLGKRNDLHNLRQAFEGGDLPAVFAAIDAGDQMLADTVPEFDDTLFHLTPEVFLASVRHDLGL